jgi:D-xylose transport system permease protein
MTDIRTPDPLPEEIKGESELTGTEAAEAERALALAGGAGAVAGSLPEYVAMAFMRVRAGDAGVLPVIAGMLLISALFQSLNSNFLTAANLVNLLVQGAVYMLLAMGETFALLLGEIDLSIGFVSGIGGIITAELVKDSSG